MIELGDLGTWFSIIVIVFLAIFSYINREGFRRGSSKGTQEVTSTILTNTIKELEGAKDDMQMLTKRLNEQAELIIRLQERLRYTCRQLDEVKSRLGLPKLRLDENDS